MRLKKSVEKHSTTDMDGDTLISSVSNWARFAKEVYDYALPIKVEINVSDTKAYVITVMKDFREVFEERQTKKED